MSGPFFGPYLIQNTKVIVSMFFSVPSFSTRTPPFHASCLSLVLALGRLHTDGLRSRLPTERNNHEHTATGTLKLGVSIRIIRPFARDVQIMVEGCCKLGCLRGAPPFGNTRVMNHLHPDVLRP